jgi:hypothetical protein
VAGEHVLPRVWLVDLAVLDELEAVWDRVRAGRMTADDVSIVQGLYRPGIVSQRDGAGTIHADYYASARRR